MDPYEIMCKDLCAVYEGDNVVLPCTSTTKSRWTKNGKVLKTQNSVSNNLIFYGIKEKDSGFYVCENNRFYKSKTALYVGGNEFNNVTILSQ